MKIDHIIDTLVLFYKIGGRDAVKRALTIPGPLCVRRAAQNKDEPEEMIAKRDAFVNATVEFVEEWANADGD